jgi:hypothetical protein
MWHLYSKIGDAVQTSRHEEWRESIYALLSHHIPKCGTSVRQTMTMLIADATPDKAWSCFAEGYAFKIQWTHLISTTVHGITRPSARLPATDGGIAPAP